MSKLKEQILKDQEVKMEYYSNFMDFIYDNLVSNELSEKDINKMEEDSKEPSTVSDLILSQKALNNIYFNNPKGA